MAYSAVDGSSARKPQYEVITIAPTKAPSQDKLRIAAYARVSSDSEDQENSFAAQVNYYSTLITSKDEWSLVDVYADEGITGTSTAQRDDFKRMLADCRKGLIDRILVKSISRFARNTKECLETIREVKSLGISVYFEKENIDSSAINSELMTAVFACFAQQESESISGNMTWAWQKRMEAGVFIPPSQPYGYKLVDKKIEVDVPCAIHIVRVFSLYLSGWSTLDIARYMDSKKEEWPELQAIKWTYKGVTRLLKNEKYAGNSLWQKNFTTSSFPHKKQKNRGERDQYYAEGTHPAIIDLEAYQKVQKRLQQQNRFKEPTAASTASPFKSTMVCAHCGGVLRRKVVRGKAYRTCRNRDDGVTKCPILPIPECEVEDAFFRLCFKLKKADLLPQMLQDLKTVQEKKMLWREDVIELNKKLSELSSQNHMLAELKKQGLIDSDIFIAQSNSLAKQIRDVKLQKERLLASIADKTIEHTQDMVVALANAPDYVDEMDSELFTTLIQKVTADGTGLLRFHLVNGLELSEHWQRK